jgi:hypothetical protein
MNQMEQNVLVFFKKVLIPGLHVDAGFNLKDVIFKQTLLPLSNFGETVIFKNRYYGPSTNFLTKMI